MFEHPLVWRGSDWRDSSWDSVTSSYAELDELLPGNGWPLGCTIEILTPAVGMGELQLLLPAILQQTKKPGWLAWLTPPCTPYVPSWQALGVQASQQHVLKPQADEWLWTAQQLLRSGCCSVLLAWAKKLDIHAMRKLQLAAEGQQTLFFLFRASSNREQSSLAPLRLALSSQSDQLTVELLKRPRGWAGQSFSLPRQLPHG